MLSSGEIVLVVNLVNDNDVECRILSTKNPVSFYPIDSSNLAVFEIKLSNFTLQKIINIDGFVAKYVVLPISIDDLDKCMYSNGSDEFAINNK